MKCPKCKTGKVKVLETRIVEEMPWRNRKCLSCNYRFTTTEVILGDNPLKTEEEKIEARAEGYRN